jgi:hypothetical protein
MRIDETFYNEAIGLFEYLVFSNDPIVDIHVAEVFLRELEILDDD